MENQSNKWHVRLWKNTKRRLMKTSLEQLICFGVKSDLPQRQIMAALFQSVSAMTTVGYNTVDVSQMVPISLLILTITMYIGASPSGIGGGL